MQLKLDLSSFKSSGVYTLEIDNSIQPIVEVESLRLVPGFSEKPPFNRPIFLNNIEDKRKLYGSSINTKLERNGCFYERFLDILLQESPCIAINLLKTNENDKVGFSSISMSPTDLSETVNDNVRYDEFFDRSRFWNLSTSNLNQIAASKALGSNDPKSIISDMYKSSIFNVSNTGTSDVTVFVIKDPNIVGYNITAEKWYENQELPYSWMNKNDYMSDYFVKFVAIKGDWIAIDKLSTDMTWHEYFDNNGLKVDSIQKFLNATGITVIGSWTGCIIPNFYNKAGDLVSIDSLVNSYSTQTGIMIAINEAALESLDNSGKHYGDIDASYKIDMIGNSINNGVDSSIKMLSYAAVDVNDVISVVNVDSIVNNTFTITPDASDNYLEDITVGTLVETNGLGLTRVIKKTYSDGKYTFTCLDGSIKDASTEGDASSKIVLHKPLQSVFTHIEPIKLQGLTITNKHRPGFAEDGLTVSLEAGVDKIYSVLSEEEGILRGLKNKDMISFRYIIDTMSGGLGARLSGKNVLANLAKSVGKCTTIINFPSVTEMSLSTDPLFCDASLQSSISKKFDTKYIPTGGNQDAHCGDPLTLPTKEEGADYIGIFSPFLKYRTGNRTILIPPAAHVANAFNSKYTGGDPYATIANLNGVISDSNVIGLEYMYDDTDRDNLEPIGINPIIQQSGKIMIYGDRTAYQDVISDLNYLHVRELLNTIELECQEVLKTYVFRANNSLTRAEIVRRLNPILEEKLISGALYSYNIVCDETNNTAEIIDRAFGVVDITVQVTKNMEKIVQRIIIDNLSE